ncbi:MAG: RecQ family zinc-binding domain-containing protein, partial [bacterium]
LERTLRLLERRKKEKYRRLHRMIDYAELQEGCRRLYILRYFGDMSKPRSQKCCDLCNPNRERSPCSSPTEKLIMRAVDNLPFSAGINKLSLILSGSKNKNILERGFEKLEIYGKLNDQNTGEIKKIIERMTDDNLLELSARKTLQTVKKDGPNQTRATKAKKQNWEDENPYPIF